MMADYIPKEDMGFIERHANAPNDPAGETLITGPLVFTSPPETITLRQWYAGQAITGLVVRGVTRPDEMGMTESNSIALAAYEIADAMLDVDKRK